MKLNPNKTKSMVRRSRTIAPNYSNHTLRGAELKELKSLRILRVALDSKLRLETHLREVVSKASRNRGVERRAGKLFTCPRVLKSFFNAYILSSLEYCNPRVNAVWGVSFAFAG